MRYFAKKFILTSFNFSQKSQPAWAICAGWSCYDHRGFSCDVILSQFCKSSYSWLPCWFPLRMVWYWKTQQNNKMFRYFLFSSYHNNKVQLSDKFFLAHTLGCNIKSFCEVNRKFKHFCCCFSLNQETWQNRERTGAYRVVQTLCWSVSWKWPVIHANKQKQTRLVFFSTIPFWNILMSNICVFVDICGNHFVSILLVLLDVLKKKK